jgi:CubicO group peptidase (beta-lactamase class C family)
VVSTTTAVAWLYQRGYVHLDDLVSSHLGQDFARNGKEGITLHHCLLHNAGFAPDPVPWYWDAAFGCPNTATEAPAEDFSCLSTLIYDSFLNETVVTAPGSTYTYSDLSFLALSYVVGTVVTKHGLVDAAQYSDDCKSSGLLLSPGVQKLCAFEAFVRTHVFLRPTRHSSRGLRRASPGPWMPRTTYLPKPASWDGIAPTLNDTGAGSYTHKRLQGQTADGDTYAMGGLAGHAGVFSTVSDLGEFISYIVGVTMGIVEDEGFLNQTTLRLFTSIHNSSQSSRALGWSTNSDEVRDAYLYKHVCICICMYVHSVIPTPYKSLYLYLYSPMYVLVPPYIYTYRSYILTYIYIYLSTYVCAYARSPRTSATTTAAVP